MHSDLPDYDAQDQAEVFDEDIMGDEGLGPSAEMRVFEELPDVYDVTTRIGDADVAGGAAAQDADEIDDDELDETDLDDDDGEDDDALDDDLEDEPEDNEVFDDDDEDLDEVDGVDDLADDEVEIVSLSDVEDADSVETTADYEAGGELLEEDVEELGYAEEEEEEEEAEDEVESGDLDLGEGGEVRKPAEGTSAEAGHLTSTKVDETDLDELHPEARQEVLLDEGVEETFPASDPVSVKRIT